MNKIWGILILMSLLSSCTVSRSIITEQDLLETKKLMINVMQESGYEYYRFSSFDTTIDYPQRGWFTCEKHTFLSELDSIQVELWYERRCIPEAFTVPYVEINNIQCIGPVEVCDVVCTIFDNVPKTEIKTLTEGSLAGCIVISSLVPALVILGFASTNVH